MEASSVARSGMAGLQRLVLAPLGHVWYAALEKLAGSTGGASGLALRIVLDRLIYDPLQLLATIVILGRLTGPSPATVLSALADPPWPGRSSA